MALWQGNSRRSKTGRRLRYARGKRKFEIGREPHLTTLGNPKTKNVRTKGDNKKIRALTTNAAYIVDQKTGKTTKTATQKDFTTLLQEEKESQNQLINAFKVLGYEI